MAKILSGPGASPTPTSVAAAVAGMTTEQKAAVAAELPVDATSLSTTLNGASAVSYPSDYDTVPSRQTNDGSLIKTTWVQVWSWVVAKVAENAAAVRTALSLGTAATSASTDFAQSLTTKTTNFTAADRGRYQISGTGIVVTDPSTPAELATYTCRITTGSTAVIGGVTYSASRFDVVRTYKGSAWTTESATISGEITINGTTSTAVGRAILGASTTADQRTALGIGESAFFQTSNLLDSTIVPAASSAIQVASVSVGSGLSRGLLFIPSGSVFNSDRVFASREQSYYLWKDGSNYWTISLVAGDATNGFVAAATSTAGVYQGNYVGVGSMSGTTLALAAPALPPVAGYGVFFGRSIYNSATNTSRLGSSFSFLAPSVAANLKISVSSVNNSGTTYGLQVVVVCNEDGTVVASSYATHANASSYTVTLAIPAEARGKQCSLATCIYDQDLASPPGGKILLKRYAVGLEAA